MDHASLDRAFRQVFDRARRLRPKYPLSLSFVLSVYRESDIERTIAKSGLRSALELRLGCDELWIDFVYFPFS